MMTVTRKRGGGGGGVEPNLGKKTAEPNLGEKKPSTKQSKPAEASVKDLGFGAWENEPSGPRGPSRTPIPRITAR